MGFNGCEIKNATLCMVNPDGSYTKIMDIPDSSIENEREEVYHSSFSKDDVSLSIPTEVSFTGRISFGKMLRCKTRKRLVKLLMSKGMSKYDAMAYAREVQKSNMTYEEYWRNYWFTGDPFVYLWK